MNDTEVTLTARLVGRMMGAVHRHVGATSMPRRSRPSSPATATRNARIVELVEAGVPVVEVAERFGISRQRVYQLLPRNVETPGWTHLRSPLRDQARSLRDQGLSQQAIADQLGIARSVMRKYLKGHERV